jgi:hypothetical protein
VHRRPLLPALAEQVGEEIVDEGIFVDTEILILGPLAALGIAPIEGAVGTLGAAGVDLAAVVARPLGRIRQQVVGRRELLELLLDPLVAGIEVGMQFLGQRAIGLLDVVGAGRGLHAQGFVGCCHGRSLRCAGSQSSTRPAVPAALTAGAASIVRTRFIRMC